MEVLDLGEDETLGFPIEIEINKKNDDDHDVVVSSLPKDTVVTNDIKRNTIRYRKCATTGQKYISVSNLETDSDDDTDEDYDRDELNKTYESILSDIKDSKKEVICLWKKEDRELWNHLLKSHLLITTQNEKVPVGIIEPRECKVIN